MQPCSARWGDAIAGLVDVAATDPLAEVRTLRALDNDRRTYRAAILSHPLVRPRRVVVDVHVVDFGEGAPVLVAAYRRRGTLERDHRPLAAAVVRDVDDVRAFVRAFAAEYYRKSTALLARARERATT